MKKEKNSMDHFFRESLKEHEIIPSAAAREAFLKEASSISVKEPIWRRILPYLAAVAAISAGTFLVWYFTKSNESEKTAAGRQQLAADNQQLPDSIRLQPTLITGSTGGSKKSEKSSKREQTYILATTITVDPAVESSGAGYPVTSQPEAEDRAIGEQGDIMTGSATPTPGIITAHDTIVKKNEIPEDSISGIPGMPPDEREKSKPSKGWFISMAAQYSPEYMFNTLENGKFISNFGIEGIFVIGNYSVRTGIGFSIGKGTNELAVEYNDYLGSYLRLDSMTFTWDGGIHNYLPSYYLSNQDVWDSLMKIDSLKVVKRYTYLQIPLILGYDIFRTERFSLGFRAGPLLSILMNTKKLSAEYDPGKKKIIKVNSITPEQIDLNWQFMIGINTAVNISRRFRVELEPMAKYYFNSVYEKPDISKKPWSIGIRAALLIKL